MLDRRTETLSVGGLIALLAACSVDDRQVDTAAAANAPNATPAAQAAAGESSDTGRSSESSPATGAPLSASSAGEGAAESDTDEMAEPPSPVLLQVTRRGDGGGAISVNVPGREPIACDQGCRVFAPPGSVVTVNAAPKEHSIVQSWSVESCGAQSSCTLTLQSALQLSLELQLRHQVAFLTSTSYLPSQLPRAGEAANAECARVALASGLHGERWVAWLSSSGGTPEPDDDIHAIEQFQHTGGWVRPDGVPVARSLAALVRSDSFTPLWLPGVSEFPALVAWSGSGPDGRLLLAPAGNDCSGWTSDSGALLGLTSGQYMGADWSGAQGRACNQALALACFGDDSDEEVASPAAAGRLVFLTATDFTPGGGVSGADALCQREACEAGLTDGNDCELAPGTARQFLSYLHTSSRRAWERFDLTGPTWVRPDGMPWLATAAELARDAAAQLTPPGVLLGPRYDSGQGLMWVGEAVGTGTCTDWTSTSGAGAIAECDTYSLPGLGNGILPQGFINTTDCATPLRLLCLER